MVTSVPEEALTARERIIELLEESDTFLTADEISYLLNGEVNPSEVYEHLRHIARSVRRHSGGKKVLLMKPPICRRCGYMFKDLSRPRKPSRCPRCRSEWIEPPAFKIASSE